MDQQPEIKAVLAGMEGKETAHGVHRLTVTSQGLTMKKMDVIRLRRTKDSWGMLLDSDIDGMIQNLQQVFALE